MVVIPLLPETRMLLDRIKARHAAEMAAQRPSRRKPLPSTVLANSRWRPWTASGIGSRFNDAKQASGVDRSLHDVRGTFVTRCCNAGLTDDEVGKLVGWSLKDVSVIRQKYCSDARALVALAERMAIKKSGEV